MLTSTGMVSPGKTNTESPTRISSVGTSTHIASAQSTLSAEESFSEEAITSLDCVFISDCQAHSNQSCVGYTTHHKILKYKRRKATPYAVSCL